MNGRKPVFFAHFWGVHKRMVFRYETGEKTAILKECIAAWAFWLFRSDEGMV